MKLRGIVKLVICIILPLAVGGLSAYLSGTGTSPWFMALAKPSFNPPPSVFAPVWSCLYILMGISLYMVITAPVSATRRKALFIFALQLFLNFWWSILFFSFHWLIISVVDIVALWLLILLMIDSFRHVKPVASYLQIPYLLWVTFASILNISIAMLNR